MDPIFWTKERTRIKRDSAWSFELYKDGRLGVRYTLCYSHVIMQYPRLDHPPNLPHLAFLPLVYPGEDIVTGAMTFEYYLFHRTWLDSANFQTQTAGVDGFIVQRLRRGHILRLERYNARMGFTEP